MKVVILAGGYGTRLSERTSMIPKPMVEIGGYPMLWHIMSLYASYGFNDFVVAGGYKVESIKDYFLNFHSRSTDFTVNLASGNVKMRNNIAPDWNVTVVDTGLPTMTGGRILRLKELLQDAPFHLTYGDGLSNVNIKDLVAFHTQNKGDITLTAVHPKAHYGELDLDGNKVEKFLEKPQFRQSWINGGFMVINPKVLDLIEGDETVFEQEPLSLTASNGRLNAFKHDGFWQCMDTLRDLNYLNGLWDSGSPPWT